MALLDEVISETTNRVVRKAADSLAKISVPEAAPADEEKKPRRRRRRNPDDMTKEEREAWVQKKREEEEARCLGNEKLVKRRRRRRKTSADTDENTDVKSTKKAVCAEKANVQAQKITQKIKRPKIIQPLEPLYMLRIPGLPKGDCLAICYARGVDQ